MRSTLRLSSIFCLACVLTVAGPRCGPRPVQVTAQVELTDPWTLDSLKAVPGLHLLEVNGRQALVRIDERQFLSLSRRGYEVSLVVELDKEPGIPEFYPGVHEVWERLEALARSFPQVAACYRIGRGGVIRVLRISDNPDREEDEPAVLFYAGLHAQEALGVVACLVLAEELCAKYGVDPRYTKAVEDNELWIVPLLNPEGYDLVLSGRVRYPWWRKNLRDNNGNGLFDPDHDGVDLNRNFGFNWGQGGSLDPGSWYYRGPYPFSEWEVAAFESLAVAQRFVAGIGFHSHGRKVLFPWNNGPDPPDRELLHSMARSMAKAIRYSLLPLNAQSGQSSVWLYGALGTLDFTVELGSEFFPERKEAQQEVRCAIAAAMWLVERVGGPGLRGCVVDARTGAPLHAQVVVQGFDSEAVWPRTTIPETGRFFRLLEPGLYRIVVMARGYRSCGRAVRVVKGPPVELVVELASLDESAGGP